MDTKTAAIKLIKFFRKNKRLPSYNEMCKVFGFASKRSSYKLTEKLIQKGFLEKDGSGRIIPNRLFPPLPILGSIKAGQPQYEEETADPDFLSFDDLLIRNPLNSYILKVSGDSMKNAGINEGDFVIVEKDRPVKNGDIVVANIDGNFTLKYIALNNRKPTLKAANEKYSDLFPGESLEIFGVVVSVARKYY